MKLDLQQLFCQPRDWLADVVFVVVDVVVVLVVLVLVGFVAVVAAAAGLCDDLQDRTILAMKRIQVL